MVIEDPARISEALSFVSSDDRATWVKMGMAIKSELGEDGFEIWNGWSQQAKSYDLATAKSVWRSFSRYGAITIGSLFHEAKANGWHHDDRCRVPTHEENVRHLQEAKELVARDKSEVEQDRGRAANWTAALWEAGTEARLDHPYLVKKLVAPIPSLREIPANEAAGILGYQPMSKGAVLTGRLLLAPIMVGDQMLSIEMIDGVGRKAALKGRGTKSGGYRAAQPQPVGRGDDLTVLIGEGVATVLSAYEATKHFAIAAFSNTNLNAVARTMHQRYPSATLVILADLMKASDQPDPCAVEAARALKAKLAVPVFGAVRSSGDKDFNDMARLCGVEAVKAAIHKASKVFQDPKTADWPEPQALTTKLAPEPYPIDALPEVIRAAVEEVTAFVKAPVALVSASALAAVSLACQALVDVKRAEKLEGPTGLYFLSIADSGERKTTCDKFFMKSIRDFEAEQAKAMKPELEKYEASMEAWTAERNGLLSAIKAAGKKGDPAVEQKTKLAKLQHDKPKSPRVPQYILGDETPESLAWRLAKEWPSAGVISSEAGLVLGAHGMGRDSVMRNMSLLNVLWDGGTHSFGRRTSESFVVKGARLTVALQVQEPTICKFFENSNGLARGTGFLARFLVTWPQSTQGQRPFSDPPRNWPNLGAFDRRISALLANRPRIEADGSLSPIRMEFDPDAKAAWVLFHDAVEVQLSSGGALYDVRDVASKIADNAARLAALFQVFEHGPGGTVGRTALDRATRIVAWHLNESRRFLGKHALPPELADAGRLDAWLIEHCRREREPSVGKNHVLQHGPLREKKRLDAAIEELISLDRIRLNDEGKSRIIEVNPKLIAEAS